MKKYISVLCAFAVLLSLVACGSKNGNETSAEALGTADEAILVGKVIAIEETSVTLRLGEISENSNDKQEPPEMSSDGSFDSKNSNTEGRPTDDTRPEKPEEESSVGEQVPPEIPSDGSFDSKNSNTEGSPTDDTRPEKPEEESSVGEQTPPVMPDSSILFIEGDETTTIDLSGATVTSASETLSIQDIAVDDVLIVTRDEKGIVTEVEIITTNSNSGMENGIPGNFGGSDIVDQGSSANTITEDGTYSNTTYTSTGDDENALRVDGCMVTLEGITVDKSEGSSSDSENGDFYGVNAALLVTNSAVVTIKDAVISSSAQNGNGVFSYGSGTTVNISDSQITTTADNSGGIQTTGGGTTNASNLTVETSGNSSAAIRSDRGGGTVNVDGGSYVSNGYNSPAVYSTATITVKNASLAANNSEALVIEGNNSITLENCDVTGNMSDTKGTSSDENVHNVMIYQSMSGDAEVGTSEFTMTGGTLIAENGDMFYITNTACIVSLSGVSITNEDSDGYLMNICGNSASRGWGTAGKNGAQVVFSTSGQTLSGDIVVDTISTLNLFLNDQSEFTGTINIIENSDGGTAVSDNAVITIGSGCTWTLTGDCTITSLKNSGTINFNGYTITLADGTVLNG